MKFVDLWFLLVLPPSLCNDENVADIETLRFVHILFRHGDRSPIEAFPTDPNKYWPVGWGELTKRGIQQHYDLGRQLRQRYIGFLSPTYNASEIYVSSTDYNRTIQSGAANLAGFYSESLTPNRGLSVGLDWLPVPIHRRLFDYLKNRTGWEIETPSNLTKIWDVLNCEREHKQAFPWPTWVNESFYQDLTKLVQHTQNRFGFKPAEVLQFSGGPMLHDMSNRMSQYVHRTTNSPLPLKYYVYSGHDSTLVPLLITLGVYNGLYPPPYASAVLLELHERDGQFVVELYFHNTTLPLSDSLHRLAIGNCSDPCTFDEFVERSRQFFLDDWKAECGNDETQRDDAVYIGTIVVLVALLSAVIMLYCRVSWQLERLVGERGAYHLLRQEDEDCFSMDELDGTALSTAEMNE